ncbi:MAG: PASTA domain-containing protein [Deltaproteobacteria bacterium]|nr:PASTA domain-containing protein [Deltaproteobacteria bacterium]MBW2047152.1 PASTA domain-containing protein [Deltaproteobacteria bacterium]MBW2109829.1 PASTA domain-containing protein [Deltaproteobacteria bacterium]MBW2352539.1 PASTA domain-containing protein [Deltaproteobacteria bacterium]
MKVKDKKWIRFRIYVVTALFLSGFGTILARAYQLQVMERDYLRGTAENGIVGSTILPPERGTIYDREGNELALSVQVGSVFAHPGQIREKGKTAARLSRILGEKKSRLQKLLNRNRSFVWIKRKISPALTRRVSDLKMPGIGVTTETRRYYPAREIAGHLIGFSGTDNQGLEGLEKRYDEYLKGPQHRLICMRDALGRSFSINRTDPSGRGMHHLVLTIDKEIQYKAQQFLKTAVKKARARGGHCLVVNPETGEVLAMAVVPEFNPNAFFKYRPDQWRNRVVTDCFEPGSTLKAFLLAAALEESAVTPVTRFYCEDGKYRVGGRVVHDTHKYGKLSVSDIVVYSSNIGAIKMGEKLGYKRFCGYLKGFGFGSRTDIGLLGERKGFIREPSEAKEIDRANLFFGQGMTTTSMQLVMAAAAIANGGKLMRPYVVRRILDESGRSIQEARPVVVRRVISGRTARKVAEILEGVVSSEGTAPEAAIRGFRVAGKTGTSQKVDPRTRRYSKSKYVALFVGFVPARSPKLVILVLIDEPKGVVYGGLVAGPVFREVGSWTLNRLKVSPRPDLLTVAENRARTTVSSPAKTPVKDPDRIATEKIAAQLRQGRMPDFTGMGMREVLRRARTLGLKVSLNGSGLAVKQSPVPGVPLKGLDRVTVSFSPPG